MTPEEHLDTAKLAHRYARGYASKATIMERQGKLLLAELFRKLSLRYEQFADQHTLLATQKEEEANA